MFADTQKRRSPHTSAAAQVGQHRYEVRTPSASSTLVFSAKIEAAPSDRPGCHSPRSGRRRRCLRPDARALDVEAVGLGAVAVDHVRVSVQTLRAIVGARLGSLKTPEPACRRGSRVGELAVVNELTNQTPIAMQPAEPRAPLAQPGRAGSCRDPQAVTERVGWITGLRRPVALQRDRRDDPRHSAADAGYRCLP